MPITKKHLLELFQFVCLFVASLSATPFKIQQSKYSHLTCNFNLETSIIVIVCLLNFSSLFQKYFICNNEGNESLTRRSFVQPEIWKLGLQVFYVSWLINDWENRWWEESLILFLLFTEHFLILSTEYIEKDKHEPGFVCVVTAFRSWVSIIQIILITIHLSTLLLLCTSISVTLNE